jgi:tRNA (cmo5U34)-methyltransferase
MLEKAKKKCPHATLIHHDLNHPPALPNATIVILNLCLQFIQPENRQTLITHIHDQLLTGGILILIEKIVPEHPENKLFFEKTYHHFKAQQGYSQNEITHKKKALENVLIPYTSQENKNLLKQAGFTTIETIFQWYSFMGIFAVK